MARIVLNSVFKEIHGELGGYVFRTLQSGATILSKRPNMSNVTWSDAQKAHRQRFKEAVAYAQAAMAEPDVRVHYEEQAASLNKRPYDLAVSDYFKDRNLLEK